MAEQHGGKRTPRNPAPVSGPGKLSRRTDGGPQQVNADMTGMDYGDNQDFNDMQASAPMAASPQGRVARPSAGSPSGMPTGGNPLFSKTQRPNEPVTAGANFGPGAGAAAAPPSYSARAAEDLDNLKRYLPDLMQAATFTDAPESFKSLVNYLRNV